MVGDPPLGPTLYTRLLIPPAFFHLLPPQPRFKADTRTGLGKSIINRKAKEARVDVKSQRYTEDNEKLNSVTHERDLDEFLNSAALADTDFTAERNNVKVVSSPSIPNQPNMQNPFLLTGAQEREVARRQAELKDGLRVPRRPKWTRDMPRQELERKERESFLEWRRGLAECVALAYRSLRSTC